MDTTNTPGTTTTPTYTSAWITPTGSFVYVGPMPIHFIVAETIFSMDEDDLITEGFVKFSTHPDHRNCPIHSNGKLTQPQLDTLWDILYTAPTPRQEYLKRFIEMES